MAFDFLQGYDDDSGELLFLNQASNVAELTKRLQNCIFLNQVYSLYLT